MSHIITYQGETLEDLNKQLLYVNGALAFEGLENWERKEYQAVKDEVIKGIESINERIQLLN